MNVLSYGVFGGLATGRSGIVCTAAMTSVRMPGRLSYVVPIPLVELRVGPASRQLAPHRDRVQRDLGLPVDEGVDGDLARLQLRVRLVQLDLQRHVGLVVDEVALLLRPDGVGLVDALVLAGQQPVVDRGWPEAGEELRQHGQNLDAEEQQEEHPVRRATAGTVIGDPVECLKAREQSGVGGLRVIGRILGHPALIAVTGEIRLHCRQFLGGGSRLGLRTVPQFLRYLRGYLVEVALGTVPDRTRVVGGALLLLVRLTFPSRAAAARAVQLAVGGGLCALVGLFRGVVRGLRGLDVRVGAHRGDRVARDDVLQLLLPLLQPVDLLERLVMGPLGLGGGLGPHDGELAFDLRLEDPQYERCGDDGSDRRREEEPG